MELYYSTPFWKNDHYLVDVIGYFVNDANQPYEHIVARLLTANTPDELSLGHEVERVAEFSLAYILQHLDDAFHSNPLFSEIPIYFVTALGDSVVKQRDSIRPPLFDYWYDEIRESLLYPIDITNDVERCNRLTEFIFTALDLEGYIYDKARLNDSPLYLQHLQQAFHLNLLRKAATNLLRSIQLNCCQSQKYTQK